MPNRTGDKSAISRRTKQMSAYSWHSGKTQTHANANGGSTIRPKQETCIENEKRIESLPPFPTAPFFLVFCFVCLFSMGELMGDGTQKKNCSPSCACPTRDARSATTASNWRRRYLANKQQSPSPSPSCEARARGRRVVRLASLQLPTQLTAHSPTVSPNNIFSATICHPISPSQPTPSYTIPSPVMPLSLEPPLPVYLDIGDAGAVRRSLLYLPW